MVTQWLQLLSASSDNNVLRIILSSMKKEGKSGKKITCTRASPTVLSM
jgi:hypothetical protein